MKNLKQKELPKPGSSQRPKTPVNKPNNNKDNSK